MKQTSRTPNFAVKESKLLLSLVRKHRNIINIKKVDKTSNDQKYRAWEAVTAEFNARNGVPERNMKTLKKKYENLKLDMKKNNTLPYGTLEEDELDPFDETQDSTLQEQPISVGAYYPKRYPAESITRTELHFKLDEDSLMDDLLMEEDNDDLGNKEDTTPLKTNLSKYSSEKLQCENNCTCTKQTTDEAKWSNEKLKTEINIMKAEHAERINILKDKHTTEMEILRAEHSERIKLMREKHGMEIRILRQQLLQNQSSENKREQF